MDEQEVREVELARAGDRDACSRLFARSWRTVNAWMLGFTRDRMEAEDLTQQTFLRAFTRLPQLREPTRFMPWLRKVARSVAIGRPRRRTTILRVEPEGGIRRAHPGDAGIWQRGLFTPHADHFESRPAG